MVEQCPPRGLAELGLPLSRNFRDSLHKSKADGPSWPAACYFKEYLVRLAERFWGNISKQWADRLGVGGPPSSPEKQAPPPAAFSTTCAPLAPVRRKPASSPNHPTR